MAGGNAPKINVGKMPRKTANLFVCVYQFASCSLGFQLGERCLHSNISHQTQKGVLQVPEKMPNQRNVRMQMRLQLQLQLQVRLRNMNPTDTDTVEIPLRKNKHFRYGTLHKWVTDFK